MIRMISIPDSSDDEEHATISDETDPDNKETLKSFDEIPEAIRRYTNKLSGKKTNVTSTEIILEIYKRNILDLTLIGEFLA